MKRLFIVLAALVLLQGAALAETLPSSSSHREPMDAGSGTTASSLGYSPAGQPDPAANPFFASLEKIGAKLYYLGKYADIDGWFVVKNGQVQIIYSSPDNKAVMVGALFSSTGDNVTITQVARLVQSNKEVAALIDAARKEQTAIASVGTQAPSTLAGAKPSETAMPAEPVSPGERLVRALASASAVVVGKNAASPEIMMIMDPNCPHCQATWRRMRDSVMKGEVHLRMIPIGAPDSDDERAAAVFLGVSDPTGVWDKYVNGDKTALAGAPNAAALTAVRANHMLIDAWKIQNTPYIVYRAKDGKIKVVEGEPAQLSAVLHDLGL